MSAHLRRSGNTAIRVFVRWNQSSSQKPTISQQRPSIPEVKGLSSNVVQVPNEPVGPGATKTSAYKNPEYFCYSNVSYYEAEVEMAKHRLPQPSNRK